MSPRKKKPEILTIYGYLPPIQTAITYSGDGDLMRIKLDCNLNISPEAVKILLMTGKRLKIVIEELPETVPKNMSQKAEHHTSKREKTQNPLYNKAADK